MAELPQGFDYLQPYIGNWGSLENQKDRYLLRQRSDMGSLKQFYDDAAPRLEEIFTYLDRFPVTEPLPASEQLLFDIRSEERRVGKEWVSTFNFGWSS